MRRASHFVNELRRRRVFPVAAWYIVAAWVVVQVAALVFPAFEIPESAIGFMWLGAIFGFPIVLFFGWRFDLDDGRVVRTPCTNEDGALPLRRTDYVILTAFTIVTVAVTIILIGEIRTTRPSHSTQYQKAEFDPASIAVLPFINISSDASNNYIADGLGEELLNILANVKGLRVTARTSSFSFRNQNTDVREIGRRLSVAHVLEGSIRIVDEKLRVTAQLVETRDGTHRWSKTYNQPFSDILSMQNDISRNIVDALRNTLNTDQDLSISKSAPQNPEAYRHYLIGRASLRSFDFFDNRNLENAITHLTAATESDAKFGDAWVLLADAYAKLSHWYFLNRMGAESETAAAMGADAGRQAAQIVPRSSEVMRAVAMMSHDFNEKETALRASLDLNPNNAAAYSDLAFVLLKLGDSDGGVTMARTAHRLDPLNFETAYALAGALGISGDLKESSFYSRLSEELENPDMFIDHRETRLEYIETLPEQGQNLDFEDDTAHWEMISTCANHYEFLVSNDAYSGDGSGYLASIDGYVPWCNTIQEISGELYAGKYVRIIGMIKTKDVSNWAGFWIEANAIDVLQVSSVAPHWIDNTATYSGWTEYEKRIYVPEDAVSIVFGAMMIGEGKMWMDNLRFEVSDNPDFE